MSTDPQSPKGKGTRLTHLDEKGAAHMVDVSQKPVTTRKATAKGVIEMTAATRDLVMASALKKGDALATARIAGIMAAKRTADLVPLCHPLSLSAIRVDFKACAEGIDITATVSTCERTGVEMEALTAVSVAALTLYDMAKAVERSMHIGQIRLVSKEGGASGDYHETA
ncbi:cyclic pyranopterin monophosphate synthase accessory protein [Iodidimonas muriae]|uniref:Cyclic pyranopterin monophosphate synthase n=1 Tax=Iodidimonas muriae TaxID=261467 RepID=A0ABQ2LED0_9PROT|nr:cyclic pyranopterin monophosphate synthase MoaC [Iodidimonas muriae]GER06976.1 cyclic pyranopterin monophosphate synthase accessory protein [Kordiimonadales bacterium JCM 17843]GGO13533.1 cyclic pyranopterin monophosphate synthase accessory protein [Iodidimonas muriae]